MAKILRNETSLLRRQEAIRRELAFRQTTRLVVWGTVCLVAAWGLFFAVLFLVPNPLVGESAVPAALPWLAAARALLGTVVLVHLVRRVAPRQ